jgi:hypothetical protein
MNNNFLSKVTKIYEKSILGSFVNTHPDHAVLKPVMALLFKGKLLPWPKVLY